MRNEYEKLIVLVSNLKGWSEEQINYRLDDKLPYLTGNPERNSQTPDRLRAVLTESFEHTKATRPNDWNKARDKAWLRRVISTDPELVIEAGFTDYFTLWGMRDKAVEIRARAVEELSTSRGTEIPFGLYTANVILTSDGYIPMAVRAMSQGFAPGSLSISFEEQLDSFRDSSPHNTVHNGLMDEFGLFVPKGSMKLLGVCAEKTIAYIGLAFLARTDKTATEVLENWRDAPDWKEASSILIVPVDKIDNFRQDRIPPEIWVPYLEAGSPSKELTLNLHPTSLWRADLLIDHLATE